VLLRNLLLQAELAAKKFTQGPAEIVYLKKCASGDKFMDTFMKDAQGYAIRAEMAQGLLERAPGDYPVAEAIKRHTAGGLCAPLVRTEGATKTQKVHKLGLSSDFHNDHADLHDDKLAATSPNTDTHIDSHRAERYKPRQMQVSDSSSAIDAADGSTHVFVLSVPRNKDRLSHFIQSSTILGYTKASAIEQIDGVDFQQFYATDQEVKSLSLTEQQQVTRQQKAAQEMFSAIAANNMTASSFSTDFIAGAMHLSPGQLATYLGHRTFWAKAAKLPSTDWAVLLEDDADLLGGPGILNKFLKASDAAAAKLHGGPAQLVYLKPCPTGSSFMDYFMRDGMGYAIRAQTAKDLLAHAPGDVPVPLAIKHVTQGGLCVPLIKNAETASFSSVH